MKNKQEVLDSINLLTSELFQNNVEILELWQSVENQKKLSTILGIKNKPLNSIKRNKSSYLFFCQETRPLILTDFPSIKPNNIMVELGKRWSSLSYSEKQRFEEMAMVDKKRYQKSKDDFLKNTKTYDSISPYLRFCNDERISLKMKSENLSNKELNAELAIMWSEYKKNNPTYLREKYDYEEDAVPFKLTPSIPQNIKD